MQKNKNEGSLDTNLLLRLVLGDIKEQTEAVEKLLARGKTFNVADVALIEMVFVLEKIYKMPRVQVQNNIEAIVNHPKINCNSRLFLMTLPSYVQNSALSIVDCVLVSYAVLNQSLPLYTFDQALIKSQNENVKSPL